ncbi:cytochrome P450 (plasmid) [Streptomyces globisporus]|uniref:cytochrome P450 family protein n=1 Tax=Streptomyces globisporus TaxID=1908 RepID=UPI002F909B40|nr:cytochrome P450 [Streptomyces globisporus]
MNEQAARARSLNQYLDPYPYFGRLREAGRAVPIRTAFAGEGWLVTRHEDAQALAGDPRLSVDIHHAGPELRRRCDAFKFRFVDSLPETMLVMDPPQHTRLRRLVAAEFTPRRVASLGPYTQSAVLELTEALLLDGPVDLVSALAEPLPTKVICRLLGLEDEDAAIMQPLVASLTLLPVDDAVSAEVEDARGALWEYLSHMVERKRRQPDDGLLSALITAHDEDEKLSHTELVSMAGLLLAGGVETTTQVIGSGLLLLLRHRDQLARLVEEPELVRTAVDEVLRFESPITLGLIRYAVEDITLGNVTIPRGELVFVGVASANHDPQRFPDPTCVDVGRQDNPHMTFGRGPHYCLGASLARLELETVFGTLIEKYPTMELACRPEDVPWRPNVLRGPQELPVRLAPDSAPADRDS